MEIVVVLWSDLQGGTRRKRQYYVDIPFVLLGLQLLRLRICGYLGRFALTKDRGKKHR